MKRARSLRPLVLVLALAVLAVVVREPRAEAWGGGSPTWVSGPFIPFAGANGQCLVSSNGQWVVGTCGGAGGAVASTIAAVIDPANSTGCASDANTVNQSTCGGTGVGPWLTWHHLNVDVWGCGGSPRGCPRLRGSAIVSFLSSHSSNSDPVIAYPSLENGASLIINGTTTSQFSGSLAGTGAKNRTTGVLLNTSHLGTEFPGLLGVNSTHSSHNWVYKVGASTVWTQPLAPSTVPFASVNAFPAEVDTWANGDAVTASSVTNVDLVDLRPIIDDYNGTATNGLYLSTLNVFDPAGAGSDNVFIGPHVYGSDVRFDRAPNLVEVTGEDTFGLCFNCYFDGGFYGGPLQGRQWWIVGGTWTSSASTFSFNPNPAVGFDGDFIFNPNLATVPGGLFGLVYLETGRTLSVFSGGSTVAPSGLNNPNIAAVWGPGNLNAGGNARLSYVTPATSTFLLTGTMTLNGNVGAAGTPILCNTAAAPQTLVQGANTSSFTLTPAHLSAACGTGGFGDRAFNFGQASIIGGLQ